MIKQAKLTKWEFMRQTKQELKAAGQRHQLDELKTQSAREIKNKKKRELGNLCCEQASEEKHKKQKVKAAGQRHQLDELKTVQEKERQETRVRQLVCSFTR